LRSPASCSQPGVDRSQAAPLQLSWLALANPTMQSPKLSVSVSRCDDIGVYADGNTVNASIRSCRTRPGSICSASVHHATPCWPRRLHRDDSARQRRADIAQSGVSTAEISVRCLRRSPIASRQAAPSVSFGLADYTRYWV